MWEWVISDELYHHGIKGQKWGERNGPPYPLTTSAKKNAYSKKESSSSNKTKSDSDASTKSGKIERAKQFIAKRVGQSSAVGGDGVEEAIAFTSMILTMTVATVISSKISQNKYNNRKAAELEERNKNKTIKSFDEAPKLSEPMSAKESAKVTNPDYPDAGTTMNCTFCTTAMALREKGYDVKASKLMSNDGWDANGLFKSAFNSPTEKIKLKGNGQNVLNSLASNGEGSYGNMTIRWKLGGGHSIFWKVENGQTHIYDGQSGEEYTKSSDYTTMFMNSIQKNIQYNRLDNCTPTEYALAVVESNK